MKERKTASFHPTIRVNAMPGMPPPGYWKHAVRTCRDAIRLPDSLVPSADKCLALGDCANACPHDALFLTPADALHFVPNACEGCGECVRACPRHLLALTPVPSSAPHPPSSKAVPENVEQQHRG